MALISSDLLLLARLLSSSSSSWLLTGAGELRHPHAESHSLEGRAKRRTTK